MLACPNPSVPVTAHRDGAALVVVLTASWLIYVDAAYAYVPRWDSAIYLAAALHIARGEGVVTLVGYSVAPSTALLLPFYLHPPGSVLPYAVAGLATGAGR